MNINEQTSHIRAHTNWFSPTNNFWGFALHLPIWVRSSEAVVISWWSDGDLLAPGRHLAMAGDIFDVLNWEGMYCLVGKGQRCCEMSHNEQSSSSKTVSLSKVNDLRLRKLYLSTETYSRCFPSSTPSLHPFPSFPPELSQLINCFFLSEPLL